MNIPDELDYNIIVSDRWLCASSSLYQCDIEDIVYMPSCKDGHFAHKDSYYADEAGPNKRLLTTKEKFLVILLRK